MPKKMLFAAAGAAFLVAGSIAWNAHATTLIVPHSLPNYSPVENVRCACGPRGCVCGHRRRVWRCWWARGRRVCGWRWV